MTCGTVDTTGRQLLASGIWNASTSLQIRGGQGMHFEITNSNVVGTTITVAAHTGETHSALLPLPGISVDFVFTLFGTQPITWTFDVSTESDAFFVSWCLWSTWVPTVPAITGLSAANGIPGTSVTVSGTGLGGVTSVHFGAIPATITYYSDTQVDVTVPPGSGTVDVTVTTPVGTSAITPADQFTYIPVPQVTAVLPSQGIAGDALIVVGTGFTGATDVRVGPQSVSPTTVSDTQIGLITPPGYGTVDITVTNPAGTSLQTAADRFTYLEVPVVTGVSPTQGLAGDLVIVSGTGFVGLVDVSFGPVSVSPLSVTDTQVQVYAPSGFGGTVDITVTNRAGTSAVSPADEFTYLSPPVVNGVYPNQGTPGTLVTVYGSGFTPLVNLSFGWQSVNPVGVVDTEIQVYAPSGYGTVDVSVTTAVGTSQVTAADQFTFV